MGQMGRGTTPGKLFFPGPLPPSPKYSSPDAQADCLVQGPGSPLKVETHPSRSCQRRLGRRATALHLLDSTGDAWGLWS